MRVDECPVCHTKRSRFGKRLTRKRLAEHFKSDHPDLQDQFGFTEPEIAKEFELPPQKIVPLPPLEVIADGVFHALKDGTPLALASALKELEALYPHTHGKYRKEIRDMITDLRRRLGGNDSP